MAFTSSTLGEALTDVKRNTERLIRTTSTQAKNKATATRKKAISATKALVARSIPGVSKLELPSPPIPHLLQSNMPPSDSQVILISNALLKAETEHQRLEQNLINMKTNSKNTSLGWTIATTHNLELAAEFIRQNKAILSPIRRLPREILEEIFLWTKPPHPIKMHKEWRISTYIPWTLGHVCRSWRACAVAASFLWNSLPPIDLEKSVKSEHQVDIIHELLIRSGERPLEEIYIYSSSDIPGHPVIDIICRHSERWQSLFFNSTSPTLAYFSTIKGRLPCLKKLTFKTSQVVGEPGDDEPAPLLDMFEDAPLLQEVRLYGTYPRRLTLPFSRLVHYRHTSSRSYAPSQVFASPYLETLTLLGLFHNIDSVPTTTLPHLVKLHISSDNESFNAAFLEKLTLPVIEEIKINTVRGNVLRTLAKIMMRSPNRHSLKNLCVRDRLTSPGGLTALLKLSPGLLNLNITIPPARDIYELGAGDGNKPLVPMLKTCNFYVFAAVPTDASKALKLLASLRCETSMEDSQQSSGDGISLNGELRPIKTLRIYFDSPVVQDAIMLQAALENWSASAKFVQLRSLRMQLHRNLPGYRSTPKLNKSWFENMDAILNRIESMDIVDAKDIYLSEIHFSVKRLSQLVFWNDEKFNVSNRAHDILKEWNLLFEQSLGDRHWAFQGTLSMVYIPDNHSIRKTRNALNIVYGFLGGSRRSGTFWPTD